MQEQPRYKGRNLSNSRTILKIMRTLKIDKTSFNDQGLIDYLDEVKSSIKEGNIIGEDWEIEGKEEDTIDFD